MFQSTIAVFLEVIVGNEINFLIFREATPDEISEHGYIVPCELLSVDQWRDRLAVR
jgi:hypothetical protein